jgi:ABC-2 type transport system permease protein
LPGWLQVIAKIIPAEHIFSAMREILYQNQINWTQFLYALGLNGLWMMMAIGIFSLQFRVARSTGALISIGE